MKKKLFIVLSILILGVFICGGIFLINRYNNYEKATVSINNKNNNVISTVKNIIKSEDTIKNGIKTESLDEIESYYEYAHKVNSQVVGWIYIPGTDINYPVLHGYPDSYYLKHNWKGESFWNGSIALDYSNSSLNNNTILINGHNMLNGIMFAQLTKYESLNFAKEYNMIYLYNGETKKLEEFKIFSAVYTQPEILLNLGNNSLEKRYATINNLLNEKIYETSSYNGNNILFLNTCLSNGTDTHIVIMSEEISTEE